MSFMDMKKKLDEAYIPDKDARQERVVVALSGGINSFVAAYLLKIQKYDLIGVTVVMNADDLNSEKPKVLACNIDVKQIDSIKEFCHQLGIPHYVLKASDEFKEEVLESWVASRLTGTKTNQCWNCHELRMRLLFEKTLELEAQALATGHLAKLFRQDSHHSVYLHTSNDEIYDQAGILSRLPHEILDKLMLPLSDLQQKEIEKLAENFGLNASSKKVKIHHCFDDAIFAKGYIESHVSKRYLKTGEVVGVEKAGDHLGIQHYGYGEVFPLPNQKANDPIYITKFSMPEKKIHVSRGDYFVQKKIFLRECNYSEETSFSEPIKGVLKIRESEFEDCWIYPKNLSCAVIELEAPHAILEGDIVTILKKKGKNSKVYLTGKVKYIIEDKPIIEQGIERVKADYANDF